MFDIGSSLRAARERQGLDFEEMERRTKIRQKYLRFLEEERFDQLPAPTYVKGFLRAYGEALGLDGDLYVDEYNSRYVAGDDEAPLRARRVPPARARRRQRRESRAVAIALVAIGAAAALVIAAWKFGGPDEPRVQGLNTPTTTAPTAATSDGRVATIELRAVRGDSYLEVRAGSSAGTPLYAGTLERGQAQRFRKKALYVSFASPANVVVKVNGTRVALPAGGEAIVTSAGARAPDGS